MGNTVRILGAATGHTLARGELGAIVARAGAGKTAVLVQIALGCLLDGRNVLHVGLDQTVRKVCLWYEEAYGNVAGRSARDRTSAWDTILPHRFVMVFPREGFTVAQLESRIAELSEQGIFHPQILAVDGLSFDEGEPREMLLEIARVARENSLSAWLTVRTHREELGPGDLVPPRFSRVADLFATALVLSPAGREVELRTLSPATATEAPCALVLDPTTLTVKERG
jgi:KaiC/GvpD/RAD55 family RecA-like ATPase